MKPFSFRHQPPVPEPEGSPATEDQTQYKPVEGRPEPAPTSRAVDLQQLRVILSMGLAFLVFWVLADWTTATAVQMRPGQLAYSNVMAQFWTASYRLVFIVGGAIALLQLTLPALTRYWRKNDHNLSASTDFLYHLTPQQRLWFSFALLFALCYLFILLLGVRLPESSSVGL